jgi:hypothetical protein
VQAILTYQVVDSLQVLVTRGHRQEPGVVEYGKARVSHCSAASVSRGAQNWALRAFMLASVLQRGGVALSRTPGIL